MKNVLGFLASLVAICAVSISVGVGQSHVSMKPAPRAVPRPVEYMDQLPISIRNAIDRAFGAWSFQKYTEDCSDEGSPLALCNLNGDSAQDYACHVAVGAANGIQQYLLAFVSCDSGYSLFVLDTLGPGSIGQYALVIIPAGPPEFDEAPFQDEGDPRKSFTTDCIMASMCVSNSCSVFLYEKGRFRRFSPCD